jgi:hypothetical protein
MKCREGGSNFLPSYDQNAVHGFLISHQPMPQDSKAHGTVNSGRRV